MNLLERILVRLGILADKEENDYLAWADQRLDEIEEQNRRLKRMRDFGPGDGNPDFPGGIGCEYDDSLWATAASWRRHMIVAHGWSDNDERLD